ncbi:DnaJ domain-containing protein [Halobacteria archaeon AArc-m2/3/4]|uniref:DnaJ domain-containing protein n=1 Tax=Natronoglomus mannanivorans TaxID=2979990 RepID=A0ABT2Q8P7_9EURY|nr:DnaJ domain-containing protein [Halobacteria archaeon AArc-m2/3/4]
MGETYYEILEISPDATQEEITAAYRERVLETHPDRNDDPDAADQFTRVTTAEEVLSDETSRARYDRLGHDAYVRMTDRFTGGGHDASQADAEPNAGSTDDATGRESNAGYYRTRARAQAGTANTEERGGPSHHARQRARRERAWNEYERAKTGHERTKTGRSRERDWERDQGRSHGDHGRSDGFDVGAAATGQRTSGPSANDNGHTETATDDSSGGFRYTVHDWDDDVDLEEPRQRLDRETIVTVCAVALLYPLLVYASLTPQFSHLVNAVVAACTLVLVGYLLTVPRAAVVSFGLWSVLVPLGLPRLTAIDPLSLAGILVVGAFWVPFGYAIAVWWALRP